MGASLTRAAAAVVAAAWLAAAGAAAAAAPFITRRGVGDVRLGMTLQQARQQGLVGGVRAGCELVSPRPYWARLRAPLRGTATFAGGAPSSRLAAFHVTGGARTARGVGPGSTRSQVERAYPGARRDFAAAGDPIQYFGLVAPPVAPRQFWFTLTARNGTVASVDVPRAEFCE